MCVLLQTMLLLHTYTAVYPDSHRDRRTHAVQALNKPVIGNTNGYVFYPITLLDSISVTDKYMYDPYQIISLIIYELDIN